MPVSLDDFYLVAAFGHENPSTPIYLQIRVELHKMTLGGLLFGRSTCIAFFVCLCGGGLAFVNNLSFVAGISSSGRSMYLEDHPS